MSHEYEEFVTNTTASTKQRDHHQDSDSDNDDILSELFSPGNKQKVPPFYPPIQGRSDNSPVTDNPKTNIMDLHSSQHRGGLYFPKCSRYISS